jgi:hypothetical protein
MSSMVEEQLDRELSSRLEAAIQAGIRQGQTETVRFRRFRRRFAGVAAACLLLFSCILSIRVSPVFASMVRQIPGLEKFVELIGASSDRSIQLAVDNDFVQPIGVSDSHGGIKFTVQGIIADEARLVVFYEVRLPGKQEYVELDFSPLTDRNGKKLPAAISYNHLGEAKQDIRKNGMQRGTVDFWLGDGVEFPDDVIMKVRLRKSALSDPSEPPKAYSVTDGPPAVASPVPGSEFKLTIPIDRSQFAKLRHEYALNQTIEVEGQKVTFSKAILTPLRVYLHLEFAEGNGKQIFDAGDIRLVDDKGTVWTKTSSFGGSHPVYHFESPYFTAPKSLTLEGSWFRALDKNQLQVVIDTDKGKILKAPDDRLSLHISERSEYKKLDIQIDGVGQEDNMLYTLFENEFTDAEGKNHTEQFPSGETTGMYKSGDEPQHSLFYIENKAYKQPLTFKIVNYPSYIRQPYKIRIK